MEGVIPHLGDYVDSSDATTASHPAIERPIVFLDAKSEINIDEFPLRPRVLPWVIIVPLEIHP